MSWNYRIFKQDTPDSAEGQHLYFLAECYYDEHNEPAEHSTMEHNHLCGDSSADIEDVYDMMAEAFKTPAIELDEKGNFK